MEYKEDILCALKIYDFLCNPRKIKVTLPEQTCYIQVSWNSDNKTSYDTAVEIKTPSIEKFKEIVEINREIKSFIKYVNSFGRTHFKDKDWLWENVLWNYRPERGESHKSLKIKWVSNYEDG